MVSTGKMKSTVGIGLSLFSLLLCVSLCSCGSNDITNPDQIIFPDSGVKFGAQVQPFLTLSCNVSGCHDSPRADNHNVALTSYINVRAINVVNQPGDTTCNLVRIVLGRDFTHFAPIHPTLNQQLGIKKWVLEGAKDN